jgi:hypothetical protein
MVQASVVNLDSNDGMPESVRMTTQPVDRRRGVIPTDDSFGMRLAMVEQLFGWNPTEAATQCNLSPRSWMTWKEGRKPRKMDEVVAAIVRRTGVDVLWLMYGVGDQQGYPGGPGRGAANQYLPDSGGLPTQQVLTDHYLTAA